MAGGSRIKGITIEIGGETTGLQNAIKDVTKNSVKLSQELKEVENALKFNPGNAELLAQKQQLLAEQVAETTQKLNILREAQSQVEQQFRNGDIGEEAYRAFQRELINTESRLNHYSSQLQEMERSQEEAGNAVEDTEQDLKGLEKQAKESGKALDKMGQGVSTAVKGIAGAAAAGAAAIGGIVAGSQDLNKELARLRSNASNAGFDLEGVEKGFEKIASVTGDTGAAVETVSNLMQTGFSDAQLSQVIDEVNGAAIRFSDTLKTEGIADGIQETFATGAAVGPFAELLERSGVSLDTFNAGLAEAAKNGTETDYVLQQLSSLGLASAYEEYKNLNPEVVAQQEAQMALQLALSKLALVLTPLVTTVMGFLTTIVEWVNKNVELVKSFDSIGEGLGVLLPKLIEQGGQIISNVVSGIVEMLPDLINTALKIVPVITDAITTLLPKVLDSGMKVLLSLIDGIVKILPNLANTAMSLITTTVTTLVKNLPKILDTGVQILKSLISGISKTLPSLITTGLNLIIKLAGELIKNLPKIINSGVEIILALIDGIISMAGTLLKAITSNIIPNIVDTLKDINLLQVGKDIIQGLVNGIKSMAGKVLSAIGDVVGGAVEWAKDLLGIASPSKVFMEIGKFTGQGLEKGIASTEKDIFKQMKSVVDGAVSLSEELTTAMYGISNVSSKELGKLASPVAESSDDTRKSAKFFSKLLKLPLPKGGIIFS